MVDNWHGYIEKFDSANIDKLHNKSSEEDWYEAFEGFENRGKFNHYSFLCCTDKEAGTRQTSFLHIMAKLEAPEQIVKLYKEKQFFMGLKDEDGKMAIEYVESDIDEYKNLYKPEYKFDNLDFENLKKIEKQFHNVIMHRSKELVLKNKLILPDLSCYLEKCSSYEIYFAVPGMYGGFSTSFEFSNDNKVVALISRSWCRVAGGSGEEHRCTEKEWKLTDSGFV